MKLSITLFLHREVNKYCEILHACASKLMSFIQVNFGSIGFGLPSSIKQRVFNGNNKNVFNSYVLLVIKAFSQLPQFL